MTTSSIRNSIVVGYILSLAFIFIAIIYTYFNLSLTDKRVTILLFVLLAGFIGLLFYYLFFLQKKLRYLHQIPSADIFLAKTNEESYRTLLEQANDGIFIADGAGKIKMINTACTIISQYTKKELAQMTVYDLAEPGDLKNNPFNFSQMHEEKGLRSERKMVRKDGSVIDIEVNAKFLSDGRFLGFIRDITERKKAEMQLTKSNERFELIARTTNEAIWDRDFETNTAWSNDVFQLFFGLLPNDPVPGIEQWKAMIHPDDKDDIISRFNNAIAGNQNSWIAEYRFMTPGGKIRNLYDRTYILRNKEGKPIRITGSMMDITSRKKAENEITKATQLADKLIDSLPGVFYFYDQSGKFIRWNNQLEIVTGYSSAEIATMHPSEFFEGKEKEYIIERILNVFEKGFGDAETNFTTKDGKKVPYYFKAVLVQYEGMPCLLGSGIDISERKKVEEELQVSEKNYRLLVEQAADAIFIVEGSGKFADVNSISSELLGYSKEELLSMNVREILYEEDLAINPIQFNVLDQGESIIRRRNFRHKSGLPVTVETHSKKLVDGRYLSMVRNLTERIESEKKLEESVNAIRQLTDHIQNVREEERAHIAREIHDELGQQLTVLKMDVSWLNKKIGNNNEAVSNKLKELTEMLDGTVKTVRRISTELRPSLLDELGLIATLDWNLKEFGKRSGIKTVFNDPGLDINLSESLKTGLFRIFQEALTNIARHSAARKVMVSLKQKENNLILSIQDDGKGFDQELLESKKTLGILGMKERTAMMGGTYEFNSMIGEGTIIVVNVPINQNLSQKLN